MSEDDDREDKYERAGEARTPAEPIAEVDNFDPETLGHSPEWWEQRDRAVVAQRARDAALLEQQRMTNRAGELRDNGFPEMSIALSLGELADTTAMHHAKIFVQLAAHGLRQRLLILAGGVGAGKTTAATWVSMMGGDPRPGFIRISELERRGRYDKSLDEWLKDKTSLVIDDVGTEVLDGKGVFQSLLDEIIDTFYGNRRTLVMTTNLRARSKGPGEGPQFAERYGDRAWSRLTQIGMWADCGVRDLRKEPQP